MINILFIDDDPDTTSNQIDSLSQNLRGYEKDAEIKYLNPHDHLDGSSGDDKRLVNAIVEASDESLDFVAIDMGLVRADNNPELAIRIGGWIREYNKITGIIYYSGTLKKYLSALASLPAKNGELNELLFSVSALGFYDRNSIEQEILFAIEDFHFELEVQRAIKKNPEFVFDMDGKLFSTPELLSELRSRSDVGQEFMRRIFKCGFADMFSMFGL